LSQLATNPRSAANVKAMAGSDQYRLRIGDWRVI
jgi:mRNA-degrading endonuclease RelE of RelBE toxin-antitoxin system